MSHLEPIQKWLLLSFKIGTEQKESLIHIGFRQGYALFSIIFNVYIQDALNKVREDMDIRVKTEGETINMIGLTNGEKVRGYKLN